MLLLRVYFLSFLLHVFPVLLTDVVVFHFLSIIIIIIIIIINVLHSKLLMETKIEDVDKNLDTPVHVTSWIIQCDEK
jgi:hypothetical protein